MSKVEFRISVAEFAWRESGKPFRKKLRTPDRDLTPDLPVINRPVQHESDALDHSATEEGKPMTNGKWGRVDETKELEEREDVPTDQVAHPGLKPVLVDTQYKTPDFEWVVFPVMRSLGVISRLATLEILKFRGSPHREYLLFLLRRFLAIWWPLKCQITKRRARIMIVFIWVIALTTTIPWAVFFDLVSIFRDAPEIQLCLEVWPEALDGDLYFLIANLVFCYILPMILISMCYVLIYIKVWRRDIPTDTKDAQMEITQQKSKVLVTVVCDICFKVWRRDIPTDTKDAQMERMQQKSKVKVVKMLVAVVILFVLSWLPLYTIFARIKLGGKTARWEEDVIQVVTPIAQWLGSSNSCINPILYAFFNKKYRRGFVAIFKSRRCCGRLRYYESVMMSSSASLRKSSYYVNNNNSSTRRPAPGQDTSVSYIFNNTGV
uniref:G-protein coupled receptors family 1 profile domain-containing protein n=1 Tax=Timema genevievae TaxID=629358 RepID=A0A7R9K097_TIMGE|nr:unnamed protein product [Timema genevievae]